MDIHRPKPWHGLREFLREYAVIVVGVLTALALEQAVEALREHKLAEEAREAIHAEMQVDLNRVTYRLNQQACVSFMYPGRVFTPQAVPPPEFTGHAESGYGVYLIQQSVDEVHFSRDDAGHCTIRFLKNRR